MEIPVLASNFYFHNCLEYNVLGGFSSVWSRRKSIYLHVRLVSTFKRPARCVEGAKMTLLQTIHFRKKVVYQLVIYSLHYLKCLSDKILHIITEIIFTFSSSFLGEVIGKKDFFISKGDFSTSIWWSPFISVELLWHPSHLLITSVTKLTVCFCYCAYISYQKSGNFLSHIVGYNWLKKTQQCHPNLDQTAHHSFFDGPVLFSWVFWDSKEITGVKRKII